MSFIAINLLFPVVLGLHNLDEYSRYDDFVRTFHPRLAVKFTAHPVIRNAAIMLTLAVSALDAFTYAYNSAALLAISKVAIFALLLNGIGHCVLSLRKRSLVPGTLSAMVLVMPYSAIAIVAMRTGQADSFRSLITYALAGALATPLTILSFLWIGYGVSTVAPRTRKS